MTDGDPHILACFRLDFEEVRNDPTTARQYREHPWLDRTAAVSKRGYTFFINRFREVVRRFKMQTHKREYRAVHSYMLHIAGNSVPVTVVRPRGRLK